MSCHKKLQIKGYKLTPQRVEIINILHKTNEHISAEEIYKRLKIKFPFTDISTIYRTLELLKKTGLVMISTFPEGITRYHIEEKGHHHHLICLKCGIITEITENIFDPLIKDIKNKYQFIADLKHGTISGICNDCQKK